MNWFTRLFTRKGLVGHRVHAWLYTPYGRAHVEGEVTEETDQELVIDRSVPERGDFRAFVRVWKRDARPLGVELPVDRTDVVGGGT